MEIANALYKRSEKIRGWCDGWAIEPYEQDITTKDFNSVKQRKKNEERAMEERIGKINQSKLGYAVVPNETFSEM